MFPGILLFAIWYSINYKFINEPQILLFYHSVRYKNILNMWPTISQIMGRILKLEVVLLLFLEDKIMILFFFFFLTNINNDFNVLSKLAVNYFKDLCFFVLV